VLFVGYPAIGKTALFKRHFEPAGYEHINQDTLKTKARCLNAVEAALKAGQSVVVGVFFPYSTISRFTREGSMALTRGNGR